MLNCCVFVFAGTLDKLSGSCHESPPRLSSGLRLRAGVEGLRLMPPARCLLRPAQTEAASILKCLIVIKIARCDTRRTLGCRTGMVSADNRPFRRVRPTTERRFPRWGNRALLSVSPEQALLCGANKRPREA